MIKKTVLIFIICLFICSCSKEHAHSFIDGKCECGEILEHTHEFINGKCECGETLGHTHEFINGKCECGEKEDLVVTIVNDTETFKINVKYNDTFINPATELQKEGFVFKGWFLNDSIYDFSLPVTDNITIIALYEEAIYEVKFVDYDGSIIDVQYIKYGEPAFAPMNPERKYFNFIGWDTEFDNITNNTEIKAVYESTNEEFSVSYVIDDNLWYYQTKEEMINDFLNDFYDFINPIESRSVFIYGDEVSSHTWPLYIGGSVSNFNYLLYKNDIDADNDDYFFNSSQYKEKWYKLSSYIKHNICKSNKRFGYPDVEYEYGALDFKRYIENNPDKHLETYGGEKIFYGYPEDDRQFIEKYKYNNESIQLDIPTNELFNGWYLDEELTVGPFFEIEKETTGDLVFYAEILNEPIYRISFETGTEEVIEDCWVANNTNIILPHLERDGYTFKGWEIDYSLYNDEFYFDRDVSIKLTAKWYNDNDINNEYLVYNNKIVTYRNTRIAVEIPENYVEKEKELRAAWVSSFISNFKPSTDELLMKEELLYVLEILEYYNMNCIIFHLRTHNNAFYQTDLAPIQEEYGNYETFNQWNYLPWFIEECHKRGIEFHAWLNPYRISLNGYPMDITCEDIALEYADYPKNPAHNPDNILISHYNEKNKRGAILNPAKQEVQDYLLDVCLELMENYDIDGIHFDDYFYTRLSGTTNLLLEADQDDYEFFIDNNETSFRKDSIEDKQEWRRQNVDSLIYKLHVLITNFNKNNKRSIEFGIAPTGVYKSGDGTVEGGSNTTTSGSYGAHTYANSLKWVQNGWLDYIMPQCYRSFEDPNIPFQDLTTWWNKAVEGTGVNLYIGIGISRAVSSEEIYTWKTEEYELTNQLLYLNTLENVKGVCMFSFDSIKKVHTDETILAYKGFEKLKEEYWLNKLEMPETEASQYE